MKKLNKVLQNEAENNTPDLYASIVAQADSENLFEVKTEQASEKNKGKKFSLFEFFASYKKAIGTLGVVALVLLVAFSVILPNIIKNPEDNVKLKSVELSVNDFYGVGAVSTIRLLNNFDNGISLQNNNTSSSGESYKKHIKSFNKYFSSFDCFLGGELISTSVTSNDDANYSQYSFKLNVVTTDILNIKSDFVLYYNEKSSSEGDNDEKYYILDGVMVYDEKEYKLFGERSLQSELNETEEEMKIRAYLSDEPDSYVEMEQEISNELGEREIEYVYRFYSHGRLIEETVVEFENEIKNNREHAEFSLSYRFGNEKGFYQTRHSEQENIIFVEYDLGGEKGEFIVTVRVDENSKKYYDYKLPNNEKITMFD